MQRDSVVFYRSFYDAIKELPAEQQVACFHAIMDYALDGKKPEGKGIEKTVFALVRPQIDTNNKRYENGLKGGKQKGKAEEIKEEPNWNQTGTKPEPNDNQEITKEEPNRNQVITKPEPNVYVYDNVNENVSVKTEREERARAREENETETETEISGNETEKIRGMEFPDFWSVYPKKVEQQMAQQEYLSLLTSTPGIEENELIQAARNYAEACQIQGTTRRFIKHPANWLADSTWIDYMPDKYKRPEERKKSTASVKNRFNSFPQRSYSRENYQSMEQKILQRAGDG